MWRIGIAALLLLGIIAAPRAQFNGCPAGFCSLVAPSGGGGAYTGPGDLASGAATVWYGFRGYNATVSTATHPVANLCDAITGTPNCADMNLGSNGDAVIPTNLAGAGHNCTTSTVGTPTCWVKKLYDQVQGNACTGATCDVSSATVANYPVFVGNCQNGKPCMSCVGSVGTVLVGLGGNLNAIASLPFTFSTVASRTSGSTFSMYGNVGGQTEVAFGNTSNLSAYDGTLVAVAGFTETNVYSIQNIFNGNASASNIYVNGSNPISPGTGTLSGSIRICGGTNGSSSQALTGNLMEIGIWAANFNTGGGGSFAYAAAMYTNQHAYWNTQ
jgi:hypothetical protein